MAQLSTSELVIVDSDFLFAEQVLDTYLDNLIEAALSFELLCANSVTYAITDSLICAGLTSLQSTMAEIRGGLEGLRSTLAGQAQAFIQEVDQLDQFVY